MKDICCELHNCLNRLPRFTFPYDVTKIPMNGIYVIFEKGEKGHGTDRIVRIGTHTGQNNLQSRLNEHFIMENKDRSIFRKNIGRALLNQNNDSFLELWGLDLTKRENRIKFESLIDKEKKLDTERKVSKYIQRSFSFITIPVPSNDARLRLESRIISTVSLCPSCRPSLNWLGLYSPKKKIRESGLWQESELYKQPLNFSELEKIERFSNCMDFLQRKTDKNR